MTSSSERATSHALGLMLTIVLQARARARRTFSSVARLCRCCRCARKLVCRECPLSKFAQLLQDAIMENRVKAMSSSSAFLRTARARPKGSSPHLHSEAISFRCARHDDVCFPHAGYSRYRGASRPPQRHRATRPRGECRSPRAGRSSPERVVRCDRWGRVEG